jgi:hypothetical protein
MSARRAATNAPRDVVKALPTVRSYNALVELIRTNRPRGGHHTNDIVTAPRPLNFPSMVAAATKGSHAHGVPSEVIQQLADD